MQELPRMRLHDYTSRQPRPDVHITPQECKPDPEASIKHDDLCGSSMGL